MLINNPISVLTSNDTNSSILNAVESGIDNLNCCKVGIVEEYYPTERRARVNLVNKMYAGVNDDGIQLTREYPPIYPILLFVGTPSNGIDYKIQKGDEVLVFFSDREISSWWDTGEINQLNAFRTHHMADAIAIAGIRSSITNTTTNNNVNIYTSVENGIINITGNTVINGNLTINGSLTVTGDATIGGISFLQHVHSNGHEGQDTGVAK